MQNDPDKQSYMPKDGTVHELTSNVRRFSEFFLLHIFAAAFSSKFLLRC